MPIRQLRMQPRRRECARRFRRPRQRRFRFVHRSGSVRLLAADSRQGRSDVALQLRLKCCRRPRAVSRHRFRSAWPTGSGLKLPSKLDENFAAAALGARCGSHSRLKPCNILTADRGLGVPLASSDGRDDLGQFFRALRSYRGRRVRRHVSRGRRRRSLLRIRSWARRLMPSA